MYSEKSLTGSEVSVLVRKTCVFRYLLYSKLNVYTLWVLDITVTLVVQKELLLEGELSVKSQCERRYRRQKRTCFVEAWENEGCFSATKILLTEEKLLPIT